MSASALGRAVEAGRVRPSELTEAFLDAAGAHPAGGRIYARLSPDRARAEAAAADRRAAAGLRRGPLDGVPVSWKDLYDTAGIATEAGSALLSGRVPDRDADLVATATAGGLVCLGKTHMSELAFAGLGVNPITATPPCVNDPDAAPGGSSSGAAASVAFGLAAAAVGSDTGGSVRVPAAWNDLVGLKTTAGLLPMTGALPLAARFDTAGPIARDVADAALMLTALSGAPATDLAGAGLSGVRLAVLRNTVLDDLDPGPAEGFEAALSRLGAAGARIEDLDCPAVDEAMPLSAALYTVEAWASWGETIDAAPEKMFDRVRDRFRAGADFGGAEYVRATQTLSRLCAAYAEATAPFDAVLAPTVALAPPKVDRLLADADHYVAQNLMSLRNARVANLMGLCALTLPTATPSAGLMLMARGGAEAGLLRLGAAAEAALRP